MHALAEVLAALRDGGADLAGPSGVAGGDGGDGFEWSELPGDAGKLVAIKAQGRDRADACGEAAFHAAQPRRASEQDDAGFNHKFFG